MNSIIVLSDGAGTTIENGVITTNTVNLQNLNINEIQGILPADNITLYTDTTGTVDLGGLTNTALNINGYDTNINAGNNCNISTTNDTIILSNNDTSITSINNTNIIAVADLIMDASANTRIGDNSVTTYINGQTLELGNILSTNNINLGNTSGTQYLNVNSKVFTGLYSGFASGSIDMQANQISINNGNSKTVFFGNLKTTGNGLTTNGIIDFQIGSTSISGKVKLTGAQQLEPSVVANGLKIGNDITSANLFLGNATYPPSCNATATTGKQITNYDTVLSMIGAGSPIIKADEIQTYTAGGTLLITATAMTCNAITLAMNSAITFNDFVNLNEITPKTGAVDMYLWTAQANLTNIWLGSLTAANTGIINIAQNNGVINIGNSNTRTANINIGGGTSFSGAINIGQATGSANTIRVGATSFSNILLRGLTTTLSGGTATLSSVTTTINGTTTNINTTSGTANIGGGTSTVVIAGPTVNINATTINIGGAGTTAINITDPLTPTYVYSFTTGTNVAGTIGNILSSTYAGNTGVNLVSGAISPVSSIVSITDTGIYHFDVTHSYNVTVAGVVTRLLTYVTIKDNTGAFVANLGTQSAYGPVPVTSQYASTSATYVFTSVTPAAPWTAQVFLDFAFSSGTYRLSTSDFRFTTTRLA